jgi:hypothetical protein
MVHLMNINKEILKYCPNFYKIIEFKPFNEDQISAKLIKLYQKYIFKINPENEEDIESVKALDKAVNKYIDDHQFRKELQKKILEIKVDKNDNDLLKSFIKAILHIFDSYEEYTTRVIYISRWI